MSISIELNFDTNSEKYVQSLWSRLKAEGLGDDLLDVQYTPHLSLGVWEQGDVSRFKEVVKRFARDIHDFPLHFAILGQFSGKEGVVFTGPVFTQELWSAHGYLHRHTLDMKTDARVQYLPNCWVPHCTLGRSLAIDDKAQAMSILNREFKPFTARINRVSLISYYPVVEHVALELTSL